MRPRTLYLRAMASTWSLYDLSDRDDEGPIQPLTVGLGQQDIVKYLAEYSASEKETGGKRLVVGVPAPWCLCATVSDAGLPRRSNAQQTEALNYRLEALLPITAESCAIDYVGPGPERLGVAINRASLESLIHALEDAGHSIEAITPQAMLAAQAWLDNQQPSGYDESASFCWQEENGSTDSGPYQLIHIDPGSPPRWRMINSQSDARSSLEQQIEIDCIDPSAKDRVWRATSETTTGLIHLTDQAIEPVALGDALEAEINAARMIVNHAAQPWINLARGPLAERHQWRRLRVPAFAAVAALVVLLVSFSLVLWLRADAYDRVTEQYDIQSAEVFAQALPGQAIPTSPKRRLQARLKLLRGESGIAGGDALRPNSTPILMLLHDLLEALPSDQRYAITDLRIEDGALRMTGYARTHSETDQIANTLRASSRFVVEPPSTDNLREGGVRFALKAKHSPPEKDVVRPEQSTPAERTGAPSLAERTQQGGTQ